MKKIGVLDIQGSVEEHFSVLEKVSEKSVKKAAEAKTEAKTEIKTVVKTTAKTGVEMESLVGVSICLNTIWDMVKYLEKDENGQYPGTRITDIRVIKKIKGAE